MTSVLSIHEETERIAYAGLVTARDFRRLLERATTIEELIRIREFLASVLGDLHTVNTESLDRLASFHGR